jgi:hypothetical protein
MNQYYLYISWSDVSRKVTDCILFNLKDKKIYDANLVYDFKNGQKMIDCIDENYDQESYEEYLTYYPENNVIEISYLQYKKILDFHIKDIITTSADNFLNSLGLEEWLI